MRPAFLRRWLCHGNFICCQYIDLPTCNSAHDTHRLGRWRYHRHQRLAAREDAS